ncbi:diphthine--ammonia ligase [Candidatus Woesearchaeota archaeon]|nr:diphthine--ammonia ligase [Candidatus Woesearchaeota archaeon]
MNVGALFSGGKDSAFAVHWARLQGWDIRCLLTMKSQRDDSYMFHTPNIDFVHEQAASLGIPCLIHETLGEKEHELGDLRVLLTEAKEKFDLQGVVVGAIASEYQRMRVNTVCHDLGLKVFSPLWHKNPEEYLHAVTSAGYSFLLTHVAAEGLGLEFLGKQIDQSSVAWFIEHCKKHKIHPAGEGGEYESFVTNGPLFRDHLTIAEAERQWDGIRGTLAIRKIVHDK